METSTRALWARTRLRVWPEETLLVSLGVDQLAEAARLVEQACEAFVALVLERDEVSLTVPQALWLGSGLGDRARAVAGPFRVITLDLDLELDVCGYLAPAAERLAEAGIPIVPQCAFRKDHLLVPAARLEAARAALEALVRSAAELKAPVRSPRLPRGPERPPTPRRRARPGKQEP